MYRFLLSVRWLVATVVVAAIVATCVSLGFWQIRRLDERIGSNALIEARLSEEPAEMTALAGGADPAAVEYRRVWARGTFLPEDEVLVRSQVLDGAAGFHVVTPLRLDDGSIVMVNRGWVPLSMDRPPVSARPPAGTVRVDGIVRLSQIRRGVGPVEPPGRIQVVSRIDLERLAAQLPGPVVPVWIQLKGSPSDVPVPLPEPDVDDEGPHRSYAIQWFSFATVGVVGFGALIRRSAHPGGGSPEGASRGSGPEGP